MTSTSTLADVRVALVLAGLALVVLGAASLNESLTIEAPSPDDSPPWVEVHCGTALAVIRGDPQEEVPQSAERQCRSAGQRRLAVGVVLMLAGLAVGALGRQIPHPEAVSRTHRREPEVLVVDS